jgi:peptidoglycan/xylan/chitin deacetylase (PgdA/CDA1 family)
MAVALVVATAWSPLGAVRAAAEGTNLIANSSVETVSAEDASQPEGWLQGNWGTNTAAFSYDTAGHTGSRSVKVQMNSYADGDAKWYFTPVAVTAGEKYDFSDYYKSTVPTSLVAQFDDGNGNYSYVDMAAVAASGDWVQATAQLTVPAGMVHVTVFHLINSVGSLSLDDASLTPAAAASTPTVNVTAPAAGTTVSGTVHLTASANDANGIAGVQFKVDGTNVGGEATSAPYRVDWNTTALANGDHTITAVARNTQGATATSDGVVVHVNNTVTPPAPGENLVPNPSVETADPLDATRPLHWQAGAWGTNTTKFTYLATGAHTGSRAVQTKVTAYTDGDAKWFFDPIAVTPDTQYRFSDYYKATVQTEVVVAFTMADGSDYYQTIGMPDASATAWKNFTTTFTVPKGAATMTVYHLIQNKGTLAVDDTNLTPYVPVGFNRALVSLTFDDGYESSYLGGLPLLQKYGFNSTQFIVTNLVGTEGYMSRAQVKAFSTAGSEIGSHSLTHPEMTTLTKAQYDKELANSQTKLQNWVGKPVTDFAFPEGLYNQAIVNDAKPLYAATRGVEPGLNSKDNFNAYDVKVQNIEYTTTAAQVADWVAQAQATKTWLVLVYHAVDPTDTSEFNVTPENLDAQLAAIKSSGVNVLTMQQALAELKPQM